ncbi:MAG TPA: hypothetical protein PKV71_05925 [Calditrichia bacterium]|nr:hypothetical protein [Calditrichia bacterium]
MRTTELPLEKSLGLSIQGIVDFLVGLEESLKRLDQFSLQLFRQGVWEILSF